MYRSIVRRDEAGKSLQKGVDALVSRSIEIEASIKGHAPAIERAAGEAAKQLVEVCGLLRSLNQTEGEHFVKLLALSSSLNETTAGIKNTMTEEVTATTKLNESVQERLTSLATEIQGLRKDLLEVTKF